MRLDADDKFAPKFKAIPSLPIVIPAKAGIQALRVMATCGQQVELQVRYHANDKRLPVVTLRRVA